MKKIIAINLLVVLALLLVIETVGQIYYHHKKNAWLFMDLFVPEVMEQHPWLVGWMKSGVSAKFGDVTITSNANHYRWTGAPDPDKAGNRYRVALLGGSTTFSTGVSDRDSWPALLQQTLGPEYAVYNYGIAGYSTAENIIQMALQVPEIKPDLVVFYEGWNDIRHYHNPAFTPDYYYHGIQQYNNLEIDAGGKAKTPWISRMARYSTIFKFIVRMNRRRTSSAAPIFDTPDPAVDRIYLRNLKTLKLLADQAGARTLFVPQIINDAMYLGKTGNGSLDPKWVNPDESDGWWSPYIRNSAMPKLMKRFNSLMAQLCRATGCPVLTEVAALDWQPDDFVDRGHFTRQGGKKFVALMANRIRKMAGR